METHTLKPQDLLVKSLGECQHDSPLHLKSASHAQASYFVSDSQRVRLDVVLRPDREDTDPLSLEVAGPRQRIFFPPAETTAAIVTCGGLSPGLNNVIRSAFYELHENYGVQRVLGIRNGYLGLNPESGLQPSSFRVGVFAFRVLINHIAARSTHCSPDQGPFCVASDDGTANRPQRGTAAHTLLCLVHRAAAQNEHR